MSFLFIFLLFPPFLWNERDVFSAWVAASQTAPPGYPPPVK